MRLIIAILVASMSAPAAAQPRETLMFGMGRNSCATWLASPGSEAEGSAMAAGISETLRDVEWIVDMIDAAAPKPGPRGPYQQAKAITSFPTNTRKSLA